MDATSFFNINGKILTLNSNGTQPMMMVFASTTGGSWTNTTSGTVYFKTANTVPNIIRSVGPESFFNLRVAGTNGVTATGTTTSSLRVNGTLTLESTLACSGASAPTFTFIIGNGAKVIRNTGSLTQSGGTIVVYPTAANFYDLVYNGASTVASGLEWVNTANIRHLTIGPESGVPNATGVTLATLGSRSISGDLTLNSGAASALTITSGGGLPMATAGSTVFRYGTGTVNVAPVYPTTINVFYGGDFTTGAELPAGAQANRLINLTVNSGVSNTVIFAGNANVGGDLLISSGTADLATFTANRQTAGGSITLAASTTLKIGGTNTFPSGYTTISLSIPTSTVEYNGTTQTIGIQNYGNLTISGVRGTNVITLPAGTIDVNGSFLPSATFSSGSYAGNAANIINFSGANGQNIPEFDYVTLTSSNNNRILTGVIGVAVTFTPNVGTYTTTSSTVNYNGTGAQTVVAFLYNNLTLSASRGANSVTFDNTGTVEVGGSLSFAASFSSGGYVVTGSTISFNGATQTVNNVPIVGYNNLTIDQTSGNATAGNNLSIAGTLSLAGGKLILVGNSLTIGNSGSISVSSPSGSKMIDLGSSGNVVKGFATPAAASFTWPIGTGANYTPASVSNLTATGTGTISIQVFNTNSPNVADPTVAMDRYWSVTTTSLTITNVDAAFTYLAGDVVGVEGSYVVRRFIGGTWINDGASIISRILTATGITNLNGEWTAGELAAFASVSVFYSLGGDWNTTSSWSQVAFGGAAAASVPSSSDVVQVGDGKTITVAAYTISASSVQLQTTGILQLNDLPSASNNLGSVTGSGILRFTNSSSSTPTFPTGNFATFVGGSGGTIEYAGTGSYTVPNQATYNKLTVAGTGTKTIGSAIVANGLLTVNSGATLGATANLTLNNTVTVNGTVSQTAGSTIFNLGAAQTMSGAPTACSFNNVELSAGTNLVNSISFNIQGNLTNNSSATTSLECSAGTVGFTGGSSQLINGSGTGRIQFNGLTIGSGSSVATAYSLEITSDITNSSNGVSGVSFNQTAGTTTINGGISQALGGAGTGTITFNNLTLAGTTTLTSTASFRISNDFTNNSTVASALDATVGEITFLGNTSTISGLGTGTIAFFNLGINGTAKLTTSKGLRLRGDLNNNSTGQGGISMSVNNVEFGFNGLSPQIIGGSGTGTLVFDDFTVLPNARVTASSSIEILGNFTNSSVGQSGISFVQSAGTTFFGGSSIQTFTGGGNGSVSFNNLTIRNTPSRINVSSSFALTGDLTNLSAGISSFAFSGTAGTITFNGTSAQAITGAGAGAVSFNNILIGSVARVNTSNTFNIAADLTNNSTGISGVAFNATGGIITFNGAADQNINGSGSGSIQLADIVISSTPSRLISIKDFSISGTWNNSSNGRSGNAFTSTSSTVTFNGVGSQSFTGSGTGTNIFNNMVIASGTRVQSGLALSLTGNFTNNSNGVSGYSWNSSGGPSPNITFNGNTTQAINGSGTGTLNFRGLRINSGTRVDCSHSIENQTSSLTFDGAGLGSPARVFSQTAGLFTIIVSGGGQSLGGSATGGIVFNNLTLNSGALGSYPLQRSFDVTNTLTVLSLTNSIFPIGSGIADVTISTNDVAFTGSVSTSGLNVTSPTTTRNHTFNISGNVIASGVSSMNTFITNVAVVALVTVNLTGTNKTISGAGASVINWARVNVSGSYTNTATGTGLTIGTDNTLITDLFSGAGTWTQGTNGYVNFNLQDAEWTLPSGNFDATATGNTVSYLATVTGTRNLVVSNYHHLILNHTGAPTNTFTNTGNLAVNGNLTLTAGTLSMDTRNLFVGGSTTWTGTLSVGDNVVTLAGSGAQSLPAVSYYGVVKSGSGTTTMLGNTTIRNAITFDAGTLATAGFNLNLGVTAGDVIGITRGTGVVNNAPVFVSGVNYDYTYNPTTNANLTFGVEMLVAANLTDLRNLTINHTGSSNNTVLPGQDVTINGALTLTAGKLDASGRVLTLKGTSVTKTIGTLITTSGGSGTELVFGTNASDLFLPDNLFDASPAPIKNITQSRIGTVTFGNQNMSITGAVTFNAAGLLSTGTGKFALGTVGTVVGEANDRYVRGNLEAIKSVTLPTSTIDFGGMGVRMSNFTQTIGSAVTVLRMAGVTGSISAGNSPGLSGNSSARTRWEITNISSQPTDGIQVELTWFGDNDNMGGCGACAISRMAIFTRPNNSSPWTRLRLGDVYQNADAGSGLRRMLVIAKHFSDFTPGYEAAPLPVTLVRFTGAPTKAGVQLQWSTEIERNANRFEIQRSIDGKEFFTIGASKAVGNSAVLRSYSYLDAGQNGGVYYRLRTVDNDNSAELSNIIFVETNNGERRLSVFPNPVKDVFKLNLSGWDARQLVEASLIGADGRIVWSGQVTPAKAEQAVNALVESLSSGVYIFRLADAKGAQMVKVVKQ